MSRPPESTSDDTRQHIVSSIFSRRDETGTPEETLIAFVKVFEDEGGSDGNKTRYLMLAVTKLGKVVLHKAKRNNNLSFSKGKTWNLEDMRVLDVVGPTEFALTMTIRRYSWTTERAKDQSHFLNAVVKVYRTYTKGEVPELINFSMPANGSASGTTTPTLSETGRRVSSSTSPLPLHRDLAPPLESTRRPSIPSPQNSTRELAPPQIPRTTRSGSSTSVVSNGSSHHNAGTSEQGYRPRPSLDEPRGSALGRSPLSVTSELGRSVSPAGSGVRRGSELEGGGRGMGLMVGGRGSGSELGVRGSGLEVGGGEDMARRGSGSRTVEMARQDSGGRSPADPTRLGTSRSPSEHTVRSINEPLQHERSPSRSRTPLPTSPQALQSTLIPPPNPAYESRKPPPSAINPPPVSAAPIITTTLPSPLIPQHPHPPSPPPPTGLPAGQSKMKRRASFHPPPLNTAFSREVLLTSKAGLLPGGGLMLAERDEKSSEEAILANVEEMLEGFDWTANYGVGGDGRKKGGADAIEGRLLDELAALDSANIHAFLESDDRIAQVLQHLDEAVLELEDIDMQITGYRMQLNAVSEDISFIESQNRGLQVQTSNQQALLDELRQLLQIVEVPAEDLRVLAQESPGNQRGVQTLEKAAASLYKALQAGMDAANAEVAATIVRMKEYQENSTQFCKRVSDYLDVTFKYQSENTLGEYRKSGKRELGAHTSMGEYLMMYEGLVLYVKEMDEDRYQKLCSSYMSTISSLHQNEIKDLLMGYMSTVNATTPADAGDISFSSATAGNSTSLRASALQKSKTAMGMKGNDGIVPKKEKRGDDNSSKIAELYQNSLTQIINQVLTEEDFISAFLHLQDTESTFADHMELDSYFRRQAARHASGGMGVGMMQLIRSMMDLVFGFVEGELRNWVEAAVERNIGAIVSVIAVTERLAREAEEENTSMFFAQLFDKSLARQRSIFDAFIAQQIRTIDSSKSVGGKRRRGVAPFVRHFPVFIERLESQLNDADTLPIRGKVNEAYDKTVSSVFGTLQQIAKLDRGDALAVEDKGQLNYHVIMIENMHQFVEDVSHLGIPALGVFLDRAKGLYEENMSTYVKMILRKSFGRFMDYFDGVERLTRTTAANEISLHASFSRSALKKVLKDYGAKDMRKAIEAMSKRVDKHFTNEDELVPDAGTLEMIKSVWREVTEELRRETGRAVGIIQSSYGDSGLGLEFGVGDVESTCRRFK